MSTNKRKHNYDSASTSKALEHESFRKYRDSSEHCRNCKKTKFDMKYTNSQKEQYKKDIRKLKKINATLENKIKEQKAIIKFLKSNAKTCRESCKDESDRSCKEESDQSCKEENDQSCEEEHDLSCKEESEDSELLHSMRNEEGSNSNTGSRSFSESESGRSVGDVLEEGDDNGPWYGGIQQHYQGEMHPPQELMGTIVQCDEQHPRINSNAPIGNCKIRVEVPIQDIDPRNIYKISVRLE